MSDVQVFTGASEIVTCESARGSSVLHDSALAVADGFIRAVGPQAELFDRYPGAQHVDCTGLVLTPGFVDSHTHALFGTWRAAEYELRARGLDYMEIARRGGGINASVSDLRARGEEELVGLTLPRLRHALAHGTTTIEIKSGYGLSLDHEIRMLRAIREVARHTSLSVVPTFLGAHDVPLEFRRDRGAYVRLLIEEMIPAVASESLAVFCDVFMEPGAFDARETRAILAAASQHGMLLKLHADEFDNSGGAELAAELGAVSADHLGAVSEQGIAALAGSKTVATLLPATLFFLGKQAYAPARRLLDAGAAVALATDFNPGTAPSASMPLVLTMACSQMRMTPLEALCAATSGGARALALENVGVLAPAARADIIGWGVNSYVEIPYCFGTPPVTAVWKGGRRVV